MAQAMGDPEEATGFLIFVDEELERERRALDASPRPDVTSRPLSWGGPLDRWPFPGPRGRSATPTGTALYIPDVRTIPAPLRPEYPASLDEVVGQRETVTLLSAELSTAKRQGRALRHILFYSAPGLGKTMLAHVLAGEAGCAVYESSGGEYPTQQAVIEAVGAVEQLHLATGKPIIWLLDEIDGMTRAASYVLHGLMTHGRVTWQGETLLAGVEVTVIGTTNRLSAVPPALKSRFSEALFVDFYSPGELAEIAGRAAVRLGLDLADDAARWIGENAGGEPRKALHVLLGAANLADGDAITMDAVREGLRLSGLRVGGLSRVQHEALRFLAEAPDRTASVASIAAYVATDPRDFQYAFEPFLVRRRLVTIGRGGRTVTETGLRYLEATA